MAECGIATLCSEASWPGAHLRLFQPVDQLGFQLRAEANEDAARVLGLEALPRPNRFEAATGADVIWLGPAEFLVVVGSAGPPDLEGRLRAAIGEARGAVVALSARRLGLELRGPAAREVLTTCSALDLHRRVFGQGSAAVTLVARVPVVLYQVDDASTYRLLVQPSSARFLVDWLVEGMGSIRRRIDR